MPGSWLRFGIEDCLRLPNKCYSGTKWPFSIDWWSDLVSRVMYCSFAILYISAFRRALATGRNTVHCSLSLCVIDQARRICARLSVGVRNMTVFSCKHRCSCSCSRPLLHDGRPCEERVHSHTLCELLTDDSSLSSGLTLGTPPLPILVHLESFSS